jgi:hypothetical protein
MEEAIINFENNEPGIASGSFYLIWLGSIVCERIYQLGVINFE